MMRGFKLATILSRKREVYPINVSGSARLI
jgi:hypothetical protein